MTPYCPKCGSIKVDAKSVAKCGKCLEPDCGHKGSVKTFRKHAGFIRKPNQHWRDPIAMLPGGYEDNQ